MIKNLRNKKLLIIGGAFQHCKVVDAAKKMGVTTYVTDYLPLEKSPAKKLADKYYMHDVSNTEEIVKLCQREKIDGAISLNLDFCQRPYQMICEKMNFPCFGTRAQFNILTDKLKFKNFCIRNGVDVIQDYSIDDIGELEIYKNVMQFPVIVKPVDSRGSRGQTVCYNYSQVKAAVNFAQSHSNSKKIIIEKYLSGCADISATYIIINGKPHLIRLWDRFLGSPKDNLERLSTGGGAPSRHLDFYLKNVNSRVISMLKKLGLKYAPVFMQGLIDNSTVRFYDPGLRFAGAECEKFYENIYGIDVISLMIEFALTGSVEETDLNFDDSASYNGKIISSMFIALKPGVIAEIKGVEKIKANENVVGFFERLQEGDIVPPTHDLSQRFCEIDLLCNSREEWKKTVAQIYDTLAVENEVGENMVTSKIDFNTLTNLTYDKNSDLSLNYKRYIDIITQEDLIQSGCFDIGAACDICENALKEYSAGNIIYPEKISVIFDAATQNRINYLPAAILNKNIYGMKAVSVFPTNPYLRNLPNLSAVILLSELKSGFPIALIEGLMCSNLRTAAISSVAAKYLAPKNPSTIGFIGVGEQAKAHFLSLKKILPSLSVCKISSRNVNNQRLFVQQMKKFYPDVNFEICGNDYESAVKNANIIVTAISSQEKILQAEWISSGALYCHIGGLEDDFKVAKSAAKIVCDNWQAVKHRSQTISQMYKLGELTDSDIYADLNEIVTGEKPARQSESEFIYFNAVGLSYVDISLAIWMYRKCINAGKYKKILMTEKMFYEGEKIVQ